MFDGKNLLPFPYKEMATTNFGGTFVAQDFGGVVLSGVPTDPAKIDLYNGPLIGAGTITLSLSGNYTNVVFQAWLYDSNDTVLYNQFAERLTINLSAYPEAVRMYVIIKRGENGVELTGVVYPQIEIGNTATEYEPYMYGYPAFPADRTINDVSRWFALRNKGYANMTTTEREEWDTGRMKGAYNAVDMNRVGIALNYLRHRFAEAGYLSGAEFTAKTNWSVADVPTGADLTYYLKCVSVIRGVLSVWATTPATPPDVGGLDYQDANDIEHILLDVDSLVTNMISALYYSGDLYSGEG